MFLIRTFLCFCSKGLKLLAVGATEQEQTPAGPALTEDRQDSSGCTALMLAAHSGSVEVQGLGGEGARDFLGFGVWFWRIKRIKKIGQRGRNKGTNLPNLPISRIPRPFGPVLSVRQRTAVLGLRVPRIRFRSSLDLQTCPSNSLKRRR